MKKNLILWPALVIVGAVLAAGTLLVVKPPLGDWVGATTNKNTQVVNAITRTQEVALVTLGIEGIRERKTENGQFLFISIQTHERRSCATASMQSWASKPAK